MTMLVNQQAVIGSFFPGKFRARIRRNQMQIRDCESKAGKLDEGIFRARAEELLAKPMKDRDQHRFEFAGMVANAVTRGLGFRLHDVQVLGIAAGMSGAIVQMQTGEGKTVVTGCVAAIMAFTEKHVHVGTTNAYLAERDREYNLPVWDWLGLSSGFLSPENSDDQSRKAYQKNITYGPGYQFGFDYLHDQIYLREQGESQLGQKTLNRISGININRNLIQQPDFDVMLIDEADSVMIDEAMTPMVISGGAAELADPMPYLIAQKAAFELERDVDFEIKTSTKEIRISDEATKRCHEVIRDRKKLKLERPWATYINNALRAANILKRDVDYVVIDGSVAIVDQNTGRIFEDRTWQDGLHQAVECKEGVDINSSPPSHARVTRQRYLQQYKHLAGFTGTALPVAAEFRGVFASPVFEVPTNIPCKRKYDRTRFFADTESKFREIVEAVHQRHRTGQPILLGARTISESELIRNRLVASGLDAKVLNGVQDEEEAEIVSQAGHFGSVTVATNMAGRGTDIKPDKEAKEAGGLHVIGISPNFSTRSDRQLAGRAARQGDPGSCQFFASAEDEIIEMYGEALGKQIRSSAKADGETRRDFSKALSALQGKLEAKFAEQRKQMVMNDRWMDKVRETFGKEGE